MIKSIHLPDDITSQMSEKTLVISKQAEQRMTHQSAMQSNRMEQDVATMLQGFHEQREQKLTTGAENLNTERGEAQ
jgi:DNA anti-recombination protein RmuC